MQNKRKPVHVVVIDDDKVQEIIFESYLKLIEIPYKSHFFVKRDEMIEYLKSVEDSDFPHLIFVDLYMPNRIGWEVVSDLESSFPLQIKNCNIFLLTSSSLEAETKEALNSSILSEILIKPIDEHKLLQLVESAYHKI